MNPAVPIQSAIVTSIFGRIFDYPISEARAPKPGARKRRWLQHEGTHNKPPTSKRHKHKHASVTSHFKATLNSLFPFCLLFLLAIQIEPSSF